jgi:hypothetical protein
MMVPARGVNIWMSILPEDADVASPFGLPLVLRGVRVAVGAFCVNVAKNLCVVWDRLPGIIRAWDCAGGKEEAVLHGS